METPHGTCKAGSWLQEAKACFPMLPMLDGMTMLAMLDCMNVYQPMLVSEPGIDTDVNVWRL